MAETQEYQVKTQRVWDLAHLAYEDRAPEIPWDVHHERQALAKELIETSSNLMGRPPVVWSDALKKAAKALRGIK